MNKVIRLSVLVSALCMAIIRADEVTDWNQIMFDSLRTAGMGGVLATRPAAIIQSAVFDAVNGVERRYGWIHVVPAAEHGASRRAAGVQAAYATLIHLFPGQQPGLETKRAVSLAAIAASDAAENSQSIARGVRWGQIVADAIWAWRSADGFTPAPPPYVGGNAVGQWRPTPPAFAPMVVPQLGFTLPWAISSPLQVTLAGPPALTSAQYAADVNEVQSLGSLTSVTRTAEQTLIARFWNSASCPNYYWNHLAVVFGASRHTTLSENARVLALINVAIADAAITVWRYKYVYSFWRPITAIQLASLDGNPATVADPTWLPLLTTPPYPEYPSGLIGTSAAGMAVLADYFGENSTFNVESDAPAMAGVTRPFSGFSAAENELVDARILGGIHFRTADVDALRLGREVAQYVLTHSCLPLHGEMIGQLGK